MGDLERRHSDVSPELARAYVKAAEVFEKEGVLPDVSHWEAEVGWGPARARVSHTRIKPAKGESERRALTRHCSVCGSEDHDRRYHVVKGVVADSDPS
jgi:hypothetical protein